MNTFPAPGQMTHYRLPYPAKLKEKLPTAMTLIVGIKFKEGVILAADSQISYGYSSQRTDTQKIEEVKFADMPVLVALAENVANARRFIDIFREQAKGLSPNSADEVGKTAQQAMRTLRSEIREVHGNCNADELNKIITERALNCSITIAVYMNREPHLIKLDLLGSIFERSRANYETDGCGASLADYILTEYFQPNESYDINLLLATYAVWQVTRHDRYCRGPVVVGVVFRPGGYGKQKHSRTWMLSREAVDGLIEIGRDLDGATQAVRNAMIRAEFEAQAKAMEEWWKKEAANLPPLTKEEIESMQSDHPDMPDDWADHDPANPSKIS